MNKLSLIFLISIFSSVVFSQNKLIEIDPDKVQMNSYVHESLPPELLKRIKSITDTFEIVDGITYEMAVDLYKRDINPESNVIIWEEMARVYSIYCKSKCESSAKRKEVYKALLLRSMYPSDQALAALQPKAISVVDAKDIILQYKLAPQPIEVMQK